MKPIEFEAPPALLALAGFESETFAVPAAAKLEAGIDAVRAAALEQDEGTEKSELTHFVISA